MLYVVDPASSTPLYVQLAAAVRTGIMRGDLRPGEKLPAARDLAAMLEINLHTVLQAYQQLRNEGLVELRRGRGAVVLARPASGPLRTQIDQLVIEAARHGLDRQALARLIVQGETYE